jgi:hypothetical protein
LDHVVAFPELGSFTYLTACRGHESGKLPAGDGVSRDRDQLCDRCLVLWALRARLPALALRLIFRRSHFESTRGHDDHLGASLVVLEPFGSPGARPKPFAVGVLGDRSLDVDAPLRAHSFYCGRRR